MGCFSFSIKGPQPPPPNLAIHLSSPIGKVFGPDDVISGHVALTPITPITPEAIEVSLLGQSLIRYRVSHKSQNNTTSYTRYRDNAALFEATENVLSGKSEKNEQLLSTFESGQTYWFPFSFQFPAGTEHTRFGQYKQDVDDWWVFTPHDLPPTFLHTGNGGDGGDADYAKVEYRVRVKLICPGVGDVQWGERKDLMATVPLLFQPLNPSLEQTTSRPLSVPYNVKRLTFQSSILTGQPASELRFRQRLRDRFSLTTPKKDLEAAVEMPDMLSRRSEFRFFTSFKVLGRTASVTHIPGETFPIMEIEALDFRYFPKPKDTNARPRRAGAHGKNQNVAMPPSDKMFEHSGEKHKDYAERKTNFNSVPEFAAIEPKDVPSYEEKQMGQAKAGEVSSTSRMPGFTPPSFKSFVITRVYRRKIKLGVEVGRKQFVFAVESHIKRIWSEPS